MPSYPPTFANQVVAQPAKAQQAHREACAASRQATSSLDLKAG